MVQPPRHWMFEWIKPGGLAVAGGVIAANVVAYYGLKSDITENRHRIHLLTQKTAESLNVDDKQWVRIEAMDGVFREFSARLTGIESKLELLLTMREREQQ